MSDLKFDDTQQIVQYNVDKLVDLVNHKIEYKMTNKFIFKQNVFENSFLLFNATIDF